MPTPPRNPKITSYVCNAYRGTVPHEKSSCPMRMFQWQEVEGKIVVTREGNIAAFTEHLHRLFNLPKKPWSSNRVHKILIENGHRVREYRKIAPRTGDTANPPQEPEDRIVKREALIPEEHQQQHTETSSAVERMLGITEKANDLAILERFIEEKPGQIIALIMNFIAEQKKTNVLLRHLLEGLGEQPSV